MKKRIDFFKSLPDSKDDEIGDLRRWRQFNQQEEEKKRSTEKKIDFENKQELKR